MLPGSGVTEVEASMRGWTILAVACALGGPLARAKADSPTHSGPSGPELPHGRLTIYSHGGPAVFDVELALDGPSHERGLMFRKEVPDGTGMLFVFPADGPRVFWMKNTLVPLDMLFISSAHKIVGILENTEPLTTSPRDPHAAARYVLELAGGTAFTKGLRVGDRVSFEGVPGG